MAASVLGKRNRHAADFTITVPPPPLNLTPVSKKTTKPPARKTTRTSIPSRANGDFESAVCGVLETVDEERTPPKRQKRARSPLFGLVLDEEVENASPSEVAKAAAPVTPSKFTSPTKKRLVGGVENIPPRTPRHRDSYSNGGGIQKIPLTPRHRVSLVGKPMTPRSQPGTPSSRFDGIPSVLGAARSMFARGAAPGKIIGRTEEREKLAEYLGTRVENGKGGCLYISGPPGTGKSALLGETLSEVQSESDTTVQKAYVNCMVMKDPKGIYARLLEEFWTENMGDVESKDGMDELEKLFVAPKGKKNADKDKRVFVVVLDEIDHLLTKDQEILYSIFEWSLAAHSRLILIGIANALDLTDRFLPRLKARNLRPQLLPFHPYSAPQIAAVISTRLKSLLPEDAPDKNYVPFIHPVAIQLCAKKVAATTGDLRKAFDMCRRGLELLESELKEKARKEHAAQQEQEFELKMGMTPLATTLERMPLGEINNVGSTPANSRRLSSPPPASAAPSVPCTPSKRQGIVMPTYNVVSGPRVMITHIARVSSAAFGGSAVSRVKTLNLQQKAVLCACCVSERRTGTAPTMRTLYTSYTKMCKKDRLLAALTNTEFRDVVGGLESAGVVSLSTVGAVGMGTPSKKGRGGGGGSSGSQDDRKVSCLVREVELQQNVAEVGPILSNIFLD
ncbi:cell division control protein [Peziza echinospora]|nr:cell division control protein [Peziza echinospora]